jgi:hypothetical protein
MLFKNQIFILQVSTMKYFQDSKNKFIFYMLVKVKESKAVLKKMTSNSVSVNVRTMR